MVAQSTDGETVQKDYETPVQILTRFTDSNRYGQRDEGRGGDDWALPFTVELAEHFTTVTYGDFSNINAGSFKPIMKPMKMAGILMAGSMATTPATEQPRTR